MFAYSPGFLAMSYDHFFFVFFRAFFAAALPFAVYGYFLPFTIGMLALLCCHQFQYLRSFSLRFSAYLLIATTP